MNADVLSLLCCPDDRSALSAAEPELVDRVNAAIRAGRIVDRLGRTTEQEIDGGLVRAAGDLLYPIVDRIPVLLRDEAIPLAQLNHAPE
jgi:uncharacterized protein YbaR (Trm112 family)